MGKDEDNSISSEMDELQSESEMEEFCDEDYDYDDYEPNDCAKAEDLDRLQSNDETLTVLSFDWNTKRNKKTRHAEKCRNLWKFISENKCEHLQEIFVRGLSWAPRVPEDKSLVLGAVANLIQRRKRENEEKSEDKNDFGFKILQSIDLFHNDLTDEECIRFMTTAFRGSGGNGKAIEIRELKLGCNRIGPKGALAIANVLDSKQEHQNSPSTLESICLYGNAIANEGTISIARALSKIKTPSNLVELNLAHNSIGNDGIEALSRSLCQNTNLKLQRLHLGNNDIGPDGAVALAGALSTNHVVLQTLGLESNRIGDDGVIAILNALLSSSSLSSSNSNNININKKKEMRLSHLNLSQNKIGNKGAKAIASIIGAQPKSSSSLKSIGLINNPAIGIRGSCALASALAKNTTLETLSFCFSTDPGEDTNSIGFRSLLNANSDNDQNDINPMVILAKSMRSNYTLRHVDMEYDEYDPISLKCYKEIKQSLHFNRIQPIKAEIVKSNLFPYGLLRRHSPSSLLVEVISKLIEYESCSALYSFLRERPSVFGNDFVVDLLKHDLSSSSSSPNKRPRLFHQRQRQLRI